MLSLNIRGICKNSGITKPYAWLKSHGISHNAAHLILSGKHRQPTLNLIERLCLLLGCVPHDILVWTPDAKQQQDVPLAELLQKDELVFDWSTDLEKLSPATLRALGEQLKALKE